MSDNSASVGRPPMPVPSGQARGATRSVIGARTWWGAATIVGIVAILGALDYVSMPGGALAEAHDLILATLYLVPLGIGALVFAVARSFERGSSVRGLWMTFALALLSFGVGGAVFIALYVITGRDTYPSFAEIFTLVGYAIFGLAFYRALRAYRGFLSLRAPMLVAATVSAAVLGAIYFTVIGPYVLGTQPAVQSALARGFNTLYIVLDVVVLLLPSVALALLLRKLGKGRVAWPWWFVAAGAASLVIPDTMFAYMGAVGMGRSVAVDMGYALAPMLIGLAVLVAREVYRS